MKRDIVNETIDFIERYSQEFPCNMEEVRDILSMMDELIKGVKSKTTELLESGLPKSVKEFYLFGSLKRFTDSRTSMNFQLSLIKVNYGQLIGLNDAVNHNDTFATALMGAWKFSEKIDSLLLFLNEMNNNYVKFNSNVNQKNSILIHKKVENFTWEGTKKELIQLIRSLVLSKKITSDGRPVSITQMLQLFSMIEHKETANLTEKDISDRKLIYKNSLESGKNYFPELLNELLISDRNDYFIKKQT